MNSTASTLVLSLNTSIKGGRTTTLSTPSCHSCSRPYFAHSTSSAICSPVALLRASSCVQGNLLSQLGVHRSC